MKAPRSRSLGSRCSTVKQLASTVHRAAGEQGTDAYPEEGCTGTWNGGDLEKSSVCAKEKILSNGIHLCDLYEAIWRNTSTNAKLDAWITSGDRWSDPVGKVGNGIGDDVGTSEVHTVGPCQQSIFEIEIIEVLTRRVLWQQKQIHCSFESTNLCPPQRSSHERDRIQGRL